MRQDLLKLQSNCKTYGWFGFRQRFCKKQISKKNAGPAACMQRLSEYAGSSLLILMEKASGMRRMGSNGNIGQSGSGNYAMSERGMDL